MKRRVLQVFGVMNRGGAELRTLALMPHMQSLGYEFHFCVLSGEEGVLDEYIRQSGGKIHYLKIGPGFIWRFMALLRTEKIHILHTHVALVSGVLVLLAALAGVKTRISHLRSTLDDRNLSIRRTLRNTLLRYWLYRFSTHVLGVCQGALECQWPDWQQKIKCKVIYNGLELTDVDYRPDFWSPWLPGYRQQKVIINLARMNAAKNHLRLLEIFSTYVKRNGDAFLVLVGKEDQQIKQQIQQYCVNEGLSERVIMVSEQQQPLHFVRHANVMLFPSLWEGLPGAVLEAASVGTPVLASAIPGCQEIAHQLKAVSTLNLNNDNQQWAEKLAERMSHADTRTDLINDFSTSDFLLEKNLRALHAVYDQ